MSDIFERLRAPFPPDRVSWRVGSTTGDKKRGLALAYIDARDVQDRLDDVVGPENWQCRYPHANGKTVCEIGLRIDGEWVWKADGAGDTDVEAEKGALSDAFKRSAVRWGIGRYLYDVPSPWVEIEQAGRSYKIKDAELVRLAKLLATAAPAEPVKPAASARRVYIDGAKQVIRLYENVEDLERWWKSDERKADCVKYGLDQSDVDELKQAVIARRDELKSLHPMEA